MKKVKITVLKKTFDEELAKEYGADGLTSDEAWKAIYQYVFALAHGAGNQVFYYGDWIKKPGVAICSCNDGLRPVIFKLETTTEESEINYEPVE